MIYSLSGVNAVREIDEKRILSFFRQEYSALGFKVLRSNRKNLSVSYRAGFVQLVADIYKAGVGISEKKTDPKQAYSIPAMLPLNPLGASLLLPIIQFQVCEYLPSFYPHFQFDIFIH